jgi:hypothetical protein
MVLMNFTPLLSAEEDNWACQELQGVVLNDKRLEDRLASILQLLFAQSTESIPAACRTLADVKATYRFFDNPKVSFAAILAPHQRHTLQRMREHPVVLLLNDISEINLTDKKVTEQLGYIGVNKTKGLFIHPLLAVTPERLPLGVAQMQTWLRTDLSRTATERKHDPIETKETYCWLKGYRQACQLAARTPHTTLVYIADRGGDIYEIYHEAHLRQDKPHAEFVLRAAYGNRLIHPCDTDDDTPPETHLQAQLATQPVIATITFERSGTAARTQRTVTQEVRAGQVWLQAPYRKQKSVADAPVNAILLTETHPPAGEDPLVWLLLTSLPIDTPEQCERVIRYYLARWEIELFFKVLKSGCQIEKLYLQTADRFMNCLAVYLLITWRLLWCTRLGRACPELPCTVVYSDAEWRALYLIMEQESPPSTPPTLRTMTHWIARCGGFLARPNNELEPGIRTMWIGLRRLSDFTLAYQSFGPRRRKQQASASPSIE